MDPHIIGHSYDQLAAQWRNNPIQDYGMAQLRRALGFVQDRGPALDLGCGGQGRMIEHLLQSGFQPEGLDLAPQMIALARERHPHVPFHLADIGEWTFPHPYDFIVAWDSTWHLPLEFQEPVLKKICANLTPNGLHLFTTVGFDQPGDLPDSGQMGVPLAYGTLRIPRLLQLIDECGCACRHLEFDQFPEKHLVVIIQKL